MTATAPPAPTAPPATRRPSRGQRVWHACRWTTLAMLLALGSAVLLLGQRPASWEQLTAALDQGRVQQVQVEGAMGGPQGISTDTEGSRFVRIVWHDRLLTRYTEVHQVVTAPDGSPDDSFDQGTQPDDGHHRIDGRIDTALHTVAPSVQISWDEDWFRSWSTIYGSDLRGGIWVLLFLPVWAAPLFLLITGPEPRHLNRWAWLWLLLSPATWLGALAYLLWGARPALPGDRRVTGGWGLLLAIALASLT